MESAASTCDGGRQEDEDEKLKRECWEEKQALGRVIFALHGYHEGTVCVCVCSTLAFKAMRWRRSPSGALMHDALHACMMRMHTPLDP